MFSCFEMALIMEDGAFEEHKILDFWKLINCPVIEVNFSKMDFRFVKFSVIALQNSNNSSAYSRCEMVRASLASLIPEIRPLHFASSIILERSSVIKMKR